MLFGNIWDRNWILLGPMWTNLSKVRKRMLNTIAFIYCDHIYCDHICVTHRLAARGRPRRGERAAKPTGPGAPYGAWGRRRRPCGFWSALSHRLGRPRAASPRRLGRMLTTFPRGKLPTTRYRLYWKRAPQGLAYPCGLSSIPHLRMTAFVSGDLFMHAKFMIGLALVALNR